eukprot:UN10954
MLHTCPIIFLLSYSHLILLLVIHKSSKITHTHTQNYFNNIIIITTHTLFFHKQQ